jgi:hypothetical protein
MTGRSSPPSGVDRIVSSEPLLIDAYTSHDRDVTGLTIEQQP